MLHIELGGNEQCRNMKHEKITTAHWLGEGCQAALGYEVWLAKGPPDTAKIEELLAMQKAISQL
jgi:hypothetical protein